MPSGECTSSGEPHPNHTQCPQITLALAMQTDQALVTSSTYIRKPSSENCSERTSSDSTASPGVTDKVRTRFYYPELDAIRIFLFFGVWAYHALPRDESFYVARHVPGMLASSITTVIKAGMCSLDAFFVLSAFLITELLLRERELRGSIDLKTFYVRRLLRIWPLYFFMIVLAAILSFIDRSQPLASGYALAFLLFVGNWIIALKGYPGASMIGPLWSVSFEEQFYLIWPLALRRASRRMIYSVAFSLFAIAAIARLILLLQHSGFVMLWYNTFVRLDSIAWGILLATILHRRGAPFIGRRLRLVLLSVGTSMWLVVGRFCGLHRPTPPLLGGMLGFPLMSLGAVVIFLAVFGASQDGLPFMKHPWLVYLGKISYGLYAYHILALRASYYLFSNYHHSYNLTFVELYALALTFSMAVLSYRWLEMPFLRLKEQKFTYVPSGSPVETTAPHSSGELRQTQEAPLNLNVSPCAPSTEP